VSLGNRADDGKTKPGPTVRSAARGVRPTERLERTTHEGWIESRPGIGDFEDEVGSGMPNRDADGSASLGMAERVIDEIAKGLSEARWVEVGTEVVLEP
jgi:hypothetical protein